MSKTVAVLLIMNLLFASFAAAEPGEKSFKPENGYVSDAETAIKIAEAILFSIYGQKTIDGQKPLKASLNNGVWQVAGTVPQGWVGGVAEIEISQDDGRIIRVMHGE